MICQSCVLQGRLSMLERLVNCFLKALGSQLLKGDLVWQNSTTLASSTFQNPLETSLTQIDRPNDARSRQDANRKWCMSPSIAAKRVSSVTSGFQFLMFCTLRYMLKYARKGATSKLSCRSGKKIVKITACRFLALLFGKFRSCCVLGLSRFGVVALQGCHILGSLRF